MAGVFSSRVLDLDFPTGSGPEKQCSAVVKQLGSEADGPGRPFPVLPLNSCVTLIKLLNFLELQFSFVLILPSN